MLWQRDRLATAARALKPLEQGSLDGLCGIYAIINAIRLAHYPAELTRPELAELFAVGLHELQSRRRLRKALVNGVPPETLFAIAAVMLKRAYRFRGMALELARADPRDFDTTWDAVHWLRRAMHSGAPVIAGFDGRLDHWTVLARYSRARLTFFDSSGHRWVTLRAVGIAEDQLPHVLGFNGVAALHPP